MDICAHGHHITRTFNAQQWSVKGQHPQHIQHINKVQPGGTDANLHFIRAGRDPQGGHQLQVVDGTTTGQIEPVGFGGDRQFSLVVLIGQQARHITGVIAPGNAPFGLLLWPSRHFRQQ